MTGAFLRALLNPSDIAVRSETFQDAVSTMTYDSEKPAELLAEDELIGQRKLNIAPEALRVTPLTEVFAE